MFEILRSLLVVLVLTIIASLFVAAEISLISLREGQIKQLSTQGRRGRTLERLTRNPNRFLAAGQVGITLAALFSAGFGGAEIAPLLTPYLVGWGIPESWAGTISFILVTILVAYLSLVIGELVPKRLALQRAERIALISAGPIDLTAKIFKPFIALLSVSTNAVVRLLGGDPHAAKEQISGEELRGLVASHEDLSVEERELIDDVFSAGDRELREVMIPRTEVEFLDASMPIFKAVKVVADQPHSRYPVIRDSMDDVVGFVHVRDILSPDLAERSIRVGELVRPMTAFPGTKGVLSTLTEMRRLRQHMSIVEDEYGGTAGIVTLEDLVEELIGDIKDEYDVVQRPEAARSFGVTTVDGLLNIEDFAEETGITLPEGPYETVAGFVVSELGDVPAVGDEVIVGAHRFEVTELDGRRIARVRVTPVPVAASDDDLAEKSDSDLPQ